MTTKKIFAGLLVLYCYYTHANAETEQETEGLPFGPNFSMSLNPIDTVPSQQLQQRLLPVGLFLVPKVISLGQQVASFSQQFSGLQQSVAVLSSSLNSAINTISTSLARLDRTISNVVVDVRTIQQNLPRCPSSAPLGSKVLGTFCYWIGTTKLGFTRARQSCWANGGTLAEPLPAFGPSLYAALRNAFSTVFTTIGTTSPLWIGADNVDENVSAILSFVNRIIYLTTNQRVPNEPNTPLMDPMTTPYGAILTTTSHFNYMDFSVLNNYVCQSSTL